MNLTAIERVYGEQAWLFALLILVFLVFSLDKLLYGSRLYDLMLNRFSKTYRIKYFGENQRVLTVFNLTLYFFQITFLSLFLMALSNYGVIRIELNENTVYNYLLLWSLAFSVLSLKLGLLLFISSVLGLSEIFMRLLTFTFNYFSVICLWMLPALFIGLFSGIQGTSWLLILLLIFVVFALISFLFLMLNNKYLLSKGLFYFILYLCTFEIAPILIVFKALVY